MWPNFHGHFETPESYAVRPDARSDSSNNYHINVQRGIWNAGENLDYRASSRFPNQHNYQGQETPQFSDAIPVGRPEPRNPYEVGIEGLQWRAKTSLEFRMYNRFSDPPNYQNNEYYDVGHSARPEFRNNYPTAFMGHDTSERICDPRAYNQYPDQPYYTPYETPIYQQPSLSPDWRNSDNDMDIRKRQILVPHNQNGPERFSQYTGQLSKDTVKTINLLSPKTTIPITGKVSLGMRIEIGDIPNSLMVLDKSDHGILVEETPRSIQQQPSFSPDWRNTDKRQVLALQNQYVPGKFSQYTDQQTVQRQETPRFNDMWRDSRNNLVEIEKRPLTSTKRISDYLKSIQRTDKLTNEGHETPRFNDMWRDARQDSRNNLVEIEKRPLTSTKRISDYLKSIQRTDKLTNQGHEFHRLNDMRRDASKDSTNNLVEIEKIPLTTTKRISDYLQSCQITDKLTNQGHEWTCLNCNYVNPAMRNKCRICSETKQTSNYERDSTQQNKAKHGSGEHEIWYGTGVTDEIRVVLIGKTGSGKSASGNTFLGSDDFKSEASGVSLTQKCSWKSTSRFGKQLMVVDTPGLFDTGMSNQQVTKEIVKCIGISSPGPHAFVLVVLIGRFTKEEQDTVQYFSEIFGEEMYNHMIVLFTRRDDIDRQNIGIGDYIQNKAPKELQALVRKCNDQIFAIDNVQDRYMREKDAENFINLVALVTRMNGGNCYSNEMYEEAEKQLERRIKEVKGRNEREKENEKRQIKEEMDFEYQEKIEKIESLRRQAETQEHEFREKIRELEQQRTTEEQQTRNELFRIKKEQEKVNMEHNEMKKMIREAEEREIMLKRQMEMNAKKENKQHQREIDIEYQNKIKIIEKQKEDAERKEHEYQEKITELEQKRVMEERQTRHERLRNEKTQQKMKKRHNEMKRKIKEAEERESAIRREKIQKEELAFEKLEKKHKIKEVELRWEERRKIEKEDDDSISLIWGGIKRVGKGIWKGIKSVAKHIRF